MSDHDPATDPVDAAYAEAESMLGDETARAVRRARVLAAVTLEPASTAAVAAAAAPARPFPWRRGGWLAAASVAGIAVLLAARLYQPDREPPPPIAATPTAPTTATASRAAAISSAPVATAPPTAPEPARRRFAHASPPAGPAPPETPSTASAAAQEAAPAPPQAAPAPSPSLSPTVLSAAPAAATAASPRPQKSMEVVVTGARIARRDKQISAERLAALPFAAAPYDPAAQLRAAAANGRTSEIQTLLGQGVAIDAPDQDGDTALMWSIRADQPAAATLLLRRGASLDQKNLSGESARDMATARDDPELDRALGLGP